MTNAIFDPVFVKGEKDSPDARFGGARTVEPVGTRSLARVPLGGGSCLRRTGHPFTVSGPCGPSQKIECVFSASPETIRREPREFDLRRSVGKRQDLAVCALCNPIFFPQAAFSTPLRPCELLQARSLVVPDPRRADTQPSSEPRQASLDCYSLSASRFHKPGPDRGPAGAPASRLPPAHAGYVCCAVWKAGCASSCRLSSFRHRKVRNN